ncbi:TetR/AcrR family transcriptional regulator [Pseudomonas fluorescens]|uniref:Uncharacterized protein n=1 Tax=Pseudomonas fluorescens TaxID=294 RepID=A0A5E7VU80_PSEFL|nr:TetR/AcrR family transcriptional regulator [Pseudomonas fluorescens]VVP58868.1 hypothetical protein PS838_05960 [Pseudomonas fluorescens]VVQ25965.1 hypothetical protein PS928_06288 [Pseudomonas fluorescens]
MSSPQTRDRLVSIIKQHQLKHGVSKLPVAKLAEAAGISRQAFNRYYSDLKDYSIGKASIARLLIDDNASLNELIENKDERILRLEKELVNSRETHKAELEAVVKNHISSLMNNDIMAFEANQLTSTLINQGNHNAYLNKRITELEVNNAKLTHNIITAASSDSSNIIEKSDKNFIAFGLNLSAANKAYACSKSFIEYEKAKDEELLKIVRKITKLPNPENIDILFFQEKYISDFTIFCNRTHPSKARTLITIKLPLYSQEEIKLFMKSLSPITSFSIYVPYSSSDAIISAKRKFSFRDIPPEELMDADNAKIPLMTWGFESIYITRVKQGD